VNHIIHAHVWNGVRDVPTRRSDSLIILADGGTRTSWSCTGEIHGFLEV
jgi:hypothetical protein